MPIYQRGKNKTWWIDFTDSNGERIRKSSGTKVKQEAQELHDKLKAESWRVVVLGVKPNYTWQQAILKYLSERENQKSIRTTKQVLRYLDLHLGDKNLNEINKSVIEQIRQHKQSTGVTIGTVNKTLTILRAVLNATKEWEWLDNSPTIKLMPDNAIRVRWLTQDQVKNLLNELPNHLHAMVRFSLATGLRESNVTGLQWSQIDIDRACAWIHADQAKSKKAIAVPLNDDALKVLLEQKGKHSTNVFTYKGNSVKIANSSAWRKALKRAGIENFRYHDLRHTWASWHIQNGTPLHVLKELGGWADLAMVMRYAHLSSDHLKNYAKNSNHGID